MRELTRQDLLALESGDRVLIRDYDWDGSGEYADQWATVTSADRDDAGELESVEWHLEGPDQTEELDVDVLREMTGSVFAE